MDKTISFQTLLEELIHYSSMHFSDEEQLMTEFKYPNKLIKEHKKEHNQFISTILDISFKAIDCENDKQLEELYLVLERFSVLWFQTHFLNTDKKLAEFLRKNNPERRW